MLSLYQSHKRLMPRLTFILSKLMTDPSKRSSKKLYSIFMSVYDQAVESGGKDSASALQAAECLGDWFAETKQVGAKYPTSLSLLLLIMLTAHFARHLVC